MEEAILALDVGTTVAKAVLFDLKGTELAVAERSLPLYTPRWDWVEQDPEEIWQAVLELLIELFLENKNRTKIIALTLATQGGSVIPVNPDGSAVNPLITWMDGRALPLVKEWHDNGTADYIRSISGWTPQPGLPITSIAWLLQNKGEHINVSTRWLSLNDFLVHRLTGEHCTNPSMAGEMLLTEMGKGHYSEELCALAGIRVEQLSPIFPSASVAGMIKADICRLLELHDPIPLINGGQDHSCEALAVNVTESETGLLACGTAWVINAIAATAVVNAIPLEMSLNDHVIPGRWIISQFLGAFGATMEWWLKQTWQNHISREVYSRTEIFSALNQALESTEPGSKGLFFLPQPIGEGGSFISLQLSQTRADMSRAIMEGVAYEVKKALTCLSDSNVNIRRLWMIGGASRSLIWRKIIADVTGLPVLLSSYSHGPALGALILACQATGIHHSLEESQAVFMRQPRVFEPDLHQTNNYHNLYQTYQSYVQKITT